MQDRKSRSHTGAHWLPRRWILRHWLLIAVVVIGVMSEIVPVPASVFAHVKASASSASPVVVVSTGEASSPTPSRPKVA